MPEPYILVLSGAGLLVALVAWLPLALRQLPLSLPIVCILIGAGLFSLPVIPDQRLHVVTGSAADVQHIMASHGLSQADCIISGLSFSTLEPEAATQIIDRSAQLLCPDGLFMAYQMRTAVRPLLEDRFGSVRAGYEWRNIPPCHLCWASEPNQPMAQ
ncbi:hypothetical protein N6H05_02470 [Sphingobium sp. WTD-1]|uniref:hypothetical protein n=1 Tax=Sphingobium sp. WTD-1 TaxID=2979467 RepID=UPI0024DE73BA|nr:hypothetical protein [Sphingobium sp. WTD-1]WIA56705.1 hypothetical protein N6H05_02470 [Sphingobium sp. WTD-1]